MDGFGHHRAEGELIRLYDRITRILRRMPIPIELPPIPATPEAGYQPEKVVRACERAYEILGDQPMDQLLRLGCREILAHWLAAREYLAGYPSSPADWRLRHATSTLIALDNICSWVLEHLRKAGQ